MVRVFALRQKEEDDDVDEEMDEEMDDEDEDPAWTSTARKLGNPKTVDWIPVDSSCFFPVFGNNVLSVSLKVKSHLELSVEHCMSELPTDFSIFLQKGRPGPSWAGGRSRSCIFSLAGHWFSIFQFFSRFLLFPPYLWRSHDWTQCMRCVWSKFEVFTKAAWQSFELSPKRSYSHWKEA